MTSLPPSSHSGGLKGIGSNPGGIAACAGTGIPGVMMSVAVGVPVGGGLGLVVAHDASVTSIIRAAVMRADSSTGKG